MIGLKIAAGTAAKTFNLCFLTAGTHQIIDRCYLVANSSQDCRRGVTGNQGGHLGIIDSYFENFREVGADSQAVGIWQNPGPILLRNNFLEGAGENVLFGGADANAEANQPQDITILRNHVFKRTAWNGGSFSVKNHLEFKNAKRILVEGNIFENTFQMAQFHSQVYTPRNQSGGNPWASVEDLTFRYNRITNFPSLFNMLQTDDAFPSGTLTRVHIHDNFAEGQGFYGTSAQIYRTIQSPNDLVIEHNTVVPTVNSVGVAFYWIDGTGHQGERLTVRSNITPHNAFGILGDADGSGITAMNTFWIDAGQPNGWVYDYNMDYSPKGGENPGGNNVYPTNQTAVKFVDSANGNYRLASDSPGYKNGHDSKDRGVNWTAFDAAQAGQSLTIALAAPAIWTG